MSRRYLDWAASAPPYPDIALEAARLSIGEFGNPSSVHASGRAASSLLEDARASLAAAIECPSESLSFTSGGTEADSIALLSILSESGRRTAVISQIEHAAVWEQAKVLEEAGFRIRRIKPDAEGFIRPADIADAIDKDTALVAVMAVNNETGAIQPIERISMAIRDVSSSRGRPLFFFSDFVQALGKIPVSIESAGVDAASFSAHKLGGPKGSGALYLRKRVRSMARGGGQEGGTRPGTQNVAGAWAFGAAASRSVENIEAIAKNVAEHERALLEGLRSIPGALPVPATRIPGDLRFSPFIVSAAFPGLGGEVLVRLLDEAGIEISTGAACSGNGKGRRVLEAMGCKPEISQSSVRISIGRDTTRDDIDAFLESSRKAYHDYGIRSWNR